MNVPIILYETFTKCASSLCLCILGPRSKQTRINEYWNHALAGHFVRDTFMVNRHMVVSKCDRHVMLWSKTFKDAISQNLMFWLLTFHYFKPLTWNNFPPLHCCLLNIFFLWTILWGMVVCENPSRSAVCEVIRPQTHLPPMTLFEITERDSNQGLFGQKKSPSLSCTGLTKQTFLSGYFGSLTCSICGSASEQLTPIWLAMATSSEKKFCRTITMIMHSACGRETLPKSKRLVSNSKSEEGRKTERHLFLSLFVVSLSLFLSSTLTLDFKFRKLSTPHLNVVACCYVIGWLSKFALTCETNWQGGFISVFPVHTWNSNLNLKHGWKFAATNKT